MGKAMDLAAVMQREKDALVVEMRIAQCPPLVAVNDMDDVARVPSKLRWNHPTAVEALAGAKGPAYVVDCPSLNSEVLWVGSFNKEYRRDFLTFLNGQYELGLAAIPKDFDVDHLYNQSRAQVYGLKFIRMALVRCAANRSHGGAYEKDITTNEAARERKDMKLMDEITSMKYFGYLSPLRNDPRDNEIEAYAIFAASRLGLDAAEVRKSVAYLREKASTPWARKN
jgi:hypothetical protein